MHRRLMTSILITGFSGLAALSLLGCNQQNDSGQVRAASPAPSVATQNAQLSPQDAQLENGREIYTRMCAACHGTAGSGRGSRPGPALRREAYVYGRSYEAVKESIRDGRPNGMPFFHHVLSAQELEDVTIYVLSLGR